MDPYAFTMMLAGAGIKRGFNWGETDEIGYHVTKDKMTPRHRVAVASTRAVYAR